ncbi:guanine nucleotide-binding protein G(f) subunit alpha [Anopheles cruzii]|uniref:guanine nucleotide-binding protein G(f) subunit alpha n=1 Tax=Anopheles cruzii TaxID=68878 RepID=UPI0022EC3798|nr:guanine nucleotide-binding protein G(f) subunit alpha [Anopheles cruzii]
MLLIDCFRRPSHELQTRKKQSSKQLEQVRPIIRDPIKILLLGAGESGKTTIIKQMRILHIQNSYSIDERLDRLTDIFENIHESIYELVREAILHELKFDSLANQRWAEYILRVGRQSPEKPSMEYVQCVRSLWADRGIQRCYKRANEFQLIESAKYFLDRVEKISMPGYIPSNGDILNCRKITTGIQETRFNVRMPVSLGGGFQEFRMFDVGGQRHHRSKWMQAFEGVQAVLFLISCGSFDQTLREDPKQNRLAEGFELFRGVWHNRFLAETGVIVFLNKQDVLEQKLLAGKSIRTYFPEYDDYVAFADKDQLYDELSRTRSFIRSKLVDITNEPPRRTSHLIGKKRSCFYHFTVATDTQSVRTVFNEVQNIVLTKNLSSVNVL